MTYGTKNEPVLYHNNHDHQPSNQLHNIYDRLNNNESSQNNSANKIIAPCVPFPSLASMEEYMILEPELRPPSPPPFLSEIDLRPDCPLYKVTSYEDAISSSLLEFCYNPSNPICLIRGIVEAVGLDLNLFSSQCLVETSSDHDMEVREQMKQEADENCDVVSGKQVWKCESSKSITTVSEYARYQQKILHKEIEERNNVCVSDNGQGEKKEREFLSFGTNVDISDEKIWSHQLQELHKLPQFLRVTCPETNLLSHVGHTVLGMNSVQLYMKVAGSRTPGHQENNNFCSLNINIGPGTCEWFAVPNSYWGVLHTLCEKHKVNFLVGSWWPVLEELYQHKVPVYRFTQYQGDVVFINPGTVHWVQANSTCNNIAWNTGPLTAHQFRMAWERYQWNKVQSVRSIVPMIHLTWNLARHIRVTDTHFYSQVRSLLESSLDQTNLLLSHLQKAGIPVVWHGRLDGEPAPYCSNCMEEVFNVLFVLSHRGEYLVYCHRCAGSMRKTFTVLQQYQSKDLEEVVTSFRLYPPEL